MTKKYVVGFLSLHDNELKLDTEYAENPSEAMVRCLEDRGYEVPGDLMGCEDEEGIKSFAFDCDAAVNAMEI